MLKTKIIADSTCDLPKSILDKYDISIIPLWIIMGNDYYKDGIDIKSEDIFAWSDITNQTPKTSAPMLNDVIEFIKPFVNQNREIIFFGISEKMSSTCNVIRLAADYCECQKAYIIDSENLSNGIGLQVVKAADLALKGATAKEIVRYIEDNMIDKIKSSFIIDTLTYLSRGGRCTPVTALIGNKLNLKPMIYVNNGAMGVGKKYRGNKRIAIIHYVHDLEKDLLNADGERIFIIHTNCDQEIISKVYEIISGLNIFEEILITEAGGVIASHCGPGTLGIMYMQK